MSGDQQDRTFQPPWDGAWALQSLSWLLPTNKGTSGALGTGSTPGTWSKAHAQVVTPAEACDRNSFPSIRAPVPAAVHQRSTGSQ